ncbi:MAG TPA: glycosyltransferase family 1 protein [Vicinamibacterales bacterium]|nr:glycosyltransferase family 1 protein [Vicinamibacterales bacterium]
MTDAPLHVAIDGRELVGQPTGVGRYLVEILRAWPTPPGVDRLSVVVPTEPQAATDLPANRVDWIVEPGATGTWWEQTRLASATRRLRPDVLFAPAYTAPLRVRCPTVLTVHDVSFMAHPEWFSWREGFRRRWLTRRSARRAAVVLTVSAFSKAEIVSRLGVPPDRIVVAPNGAPAPITPAPSGERAPIVLYVGSLFTRRRIPDLIRGFAIAARQVPDARLVLIGANRTHPPVDPVAIARTLGVEHRVEWHAWVTDEERDGWYGRARVFAFLSDYEGFGLTPFEAIAHGAPAIVLDTPLSREVYGTGARFVAPTPAGIGDALATLLTDRPARAALLAEGQRQAARRPWSTTAAIVRETLVRAAHA